MSAKLVPTSADPFYSQTSSLDGVPYLLSFAYNQRADCWYLNLATLEGQDIACGIKLVCYWPLLLKCASPLKPPGDLFVLSSTTDKSAPGLTDLLPTGRCSLIYMPAADVAAIAAGLPPP